MRRYVKTVYLMKLNYNDDQLELKIKQAFGEENVEDILIMLGLKK